MSEKKIGTLESFQPLIIDETHKTWSNAYGQYWDFFGTIDGVKGIFSAKSTTPRWEQGQKVSYTSTHKEGNQYPKFKMEKLDEHTQKPVASSYNDPASIRSQAYGTATEQALRTFVELEKAVESPDKVDALAKFYYAWLMKEIKDTLQQQGLNVDERHIILIADIMIFTGEIKAIGRYGVAGMKSSVLTRAGFEETVKHLVKASVRNEEDNFKGMFENVMVNQQVPAGTGMFDLIARLGEN